MDCLVQISSSTRIIQVTFVGSSKKKKDLKKLYGPFYGWGFNCFKATEPLRGDSLLFTTKFRGISVISRGKISFADFLFVCKYGSAIVCICPHYSRIFLRKVAGRKRKHKCNKKRIGKIEN